MMGSESEFCDRANRNGLKFWFNTKAAVTHIIRPHQMSRDFVRARAFRHGCGVAYRESLEKKGPNFASLTLQKAYWIIREWRYRLFPEARNDENLWNFNWKRGYVQTKLKLINAV
jgi:GT2 family glycosyltransferase